MLFKEFLTKIMNSIFINYGYVDKVGSGIAQGLFNVSARKLVKIVLYKIKAIALILGKVLFFVGCMVVLQKILGIGIEQHIYYAAPDREFSQALSDLQIRYQANFENSQQLLIDSGILKIDFYNIPHDILPIPKVNKALPEVTQVLPELPQESFFKKIFNFFNRTFCSFFFNNTNIVEEILEEDLIDNIELLQEIKPCFTISSKTKINDSFWVNCVLKEINPFSIDSNMIDKVSILPFHFQKNMSFILINSVMNQVDIDDSLIKYLEYFERLEDVSEELFCNILSKNNPDSSFDLETLNNFNKIFIESVPEARIILDNLRLFDTFILNFFVNYFEVHSISNTGLKMSDYIYQNFMTNSLLKPFYNNGASIEDVIEIIKYFDDTHSEPELFIKYQTHLLLSGELLTQFENWAVENNFDLVTIQEEEF